jgi:hypothetical protein
MTPRLPWLASAAWFVALAVLLTWPLVLTPFTRLAALHGPGDPYLNLWALGWDLQTISETPSKLLTGQVFDANIFHPARQTLTYSDHLLLQALAVWPAYALTGSLVFSYNLLFFASLVASALAMFVFIRAVTGSAWGATVAGTAWGFWPYHFAHLPHVQLQALYFMPLAFVFLHRLVASRRRRDAVGLGVMTGLQAVGSVYYGVIGAVGLAVSALLLARAAGGRRVGLLIRRLLLAGLVGVVVVAPVLWPYVQAQQREGFGRNLLEAERHAATWRAYFGVPEVNALYGATGLLWTEPGAEASLFPGFVVIGLAFVGAYAAGRQGSRPHAVSAYGLIVCGIVLSLGPDGVRPLYALLQKWIFGFQAIRAPARFAVLVTFGLVLLAALGLRELVSRRQPVPSSDATTRGVTAAAKAATRLALLPIVLLVLMAVEYANRSLPWVEAPALTTPVGRWLKDAPAPGAVVYLPLTHDVDNTPFMVESLEHRRPIVNGYSGQRPAFYSAVVDSLHDFPTAEALWTLHDLDVRYIVTTDRMTADVPLVERANFSGDPAGASGRVVYELVWSPEAEAMLGEPVVPEPPPPGPIPFAAGEQASYRVDWYGPAGRVNAGTIVLSVEPGEPSVNAAYRLRVRLRTAPWISRFFEADDEFLTDVTSDVMSVRHERRLREGRRVVDEAYVFDRGAGQVRWVDDAARPPLRLWPGARDPVAAFYYLRTLALAPGTRLQIPVNDNGRNLGLDVQVGGVERVRIGAREEEALRVTPVVRQRVSRRSLPTMTVWLGRDPSRLPLAADVEAAFGTVRLELEHHRTR